MQTTLRKIQQSRICDHIRDKIIKCSIKTSLGVLCKKWTIIIIREDIGDYKTRRFYRLLESIPGITPRILLMLLNELEKKGFGKDILPILRQLVVFGSKWYSNVVFEDKISRKLTEISRYPQAREAVNCICSAACCSNLTCFLLLTIFTCSQKIT